MPSDSNAPTSRKNKSKAALLPAETHQTVAKVAGALTTNHGVPISDNQNSLKAGVRGPTLLEDFVLREKITHFDHERIPEPRLPKPAAFGNERPPSAGLDNLRRT